MTAVHSLFDFVCSHRYHRLELASQEADNAAAGDDVDGALFAIDAREHFVKAIQRLCEVDGQRVAHFTK